MKEFKLKRIATSRSGSSIVSAQSIRKLRERMDIDKTLQRGRRGFLDYSSRSLSFYVDFYEDERSIDNEVLQSLGIRVNHMEGR